MIEKSNLSKSTNEKGSELTKQLSINSKIFNFIVKILDGLLYSFIGPFAVLYIIPQFFLKFELHPRLDGFGLEWLAQLGKILMWSGAGLAIWCGLLMNLFSRGTPLVTSPPKSILERNVYSYVRNPMMWALIFTLLGEALNFGSSILFVWLLAWLRIGHLIVINYEEPQLKFRFGKEYLDYCKKVPRWIPKLSK